MSTVTLPEHSEVIELMNGLFGLDIQAAAHTDADVHVIAEYVDDSGTPVAWIGCDLAGACRMGAALTQVPAGRVDEAVSDGQIPESLAENLDEIFNISVNLIAAGSGHTVFLRSVTRGADAEFDATCEAMKGCSGLDIDFDIARYGVCRLVIAR